MKGGRRTGEEMSWSNMCGSARLVVLLKGEHCLIPLRFDSSSALLSRATRCHGDVAGSSVMFGMLVANSSNAWMFLCFPPMQEESSKDF